MYLNDAFFNGHPKKSNQRKEKEKLDAYVWPFTLIFLGILIVVFSMTMFLTFISFVFHHLVSKGLVPPVLEFHHILSEIPVLRLIIGYIVAVVVVFLV